uniref:Peptidase S1 domain-containing protein n=1 Tax=Phlebotomus papatasi TaxID=29031 RepID=A0A1B0DF52_PHLPP
MTLLGTIAKVFVIVSALTQLIRCQPNSPCPRIFNYIYNGQHWQGAIEVTSPPIGVTMNLAVVLLVPQKIDTEDLGSLELWINRENTLQRIANNQKVRYRVKFPPEAPIPRVSSIIYNGKRICTNKPNYLEGLLVTQIRLEHTLYTALAKERLSVGENYDKIAEKGEPEVIFQNRFGITKHTEQQCGKIQSKFTVTNLMMYGNKMERGSWPWLVALHAYKSTSLSFICGGTLISDRIILSAAHCFHNRHDQLFVASDVIAFLGKHNLRKLTEKG